MPLLGDLLQDRAASVLVAALGLGDQLLDVGAQHLGLRLRGREAAVFDELSRQVRQNQLLVCRASAQTSTLLGVGMCFSYGFNASIGRTGSDGLVVRKIAADSESPKLGITESFSVIPRAARDSLI